MILPVTPPPLPQVGVAFKKNEEGGEVDGRIEGKSGWVEQAPQKKKGGNYVWFNPLGAEQPWQGGSFLGCGIFCWCFMQVRKTVTGAGVVLNLDHHHHHRKTVEREDQS